MQQSCPGAVAAFYMAYLQEDASLPAAGEQEPSRPSAAALPSTRASTKPSAGTTGCSPDHLPVQVLPGDLLQHVFRLSLWCTLMARHVHKRLCCGAYISVRLGAVHLSAGTWQYNHDHVRFRQVAADSMTSAG